MAIELKYADIIPVTPSVTEISEIFIYIVGGSVIIVTIILIVLVVKKKRKNLPPPPAPPPPAPAPNHKPQNIYPSKAWKLLGKMPNGEQFKYKIDTVQLENGILLGRSSTADINLNSSKVSGEHARISLFKGDMVIKDLNSTNGSYLNGKKIAPNAKETIRDGDDL